MNKWYGSVGFSEIVDKGSGVFEERIIAKKYYGDILKNSKQPYNNEIINGVNVSNRISILADPYCYMNAYRIVYIEFMGTKWKVKDLEIQQPRLVISLGGVYNEEL